MKAEGKSNRQIGRELGIDEGTARNRGKAAEKICSVQKFRRTEDRQALRNGAWRPTAAIGGSAMGWDGRPPSFDATRCGRSAAG
jgi:hypothetical protein